ncbi:MAG: PEP-CTERM sorting domain-containing protein [bacterium]
MRNVFLCLLALGIILFASACWAVSFVNGSFEEAGNLTGWTTHGTVSQVHSGTVTFDTYSYDITAQQGDSMALLSAPGLSGGGSYNNNWISQNLVGFQGGVVSFYYNLFSTDWEGNDRFTVKFYDEHNDEIVDARLELDEYAADKPIVDLALYYSDWQYFSHNFGAYTGPLTMSMSIKLASGNGGDDNYNTWAYVDNFTLTPPAPVPEPGAIFLFGFGLMGLIGIKRKIWKV